MSDIILRIHTSTLYKTKSDVYHWAAVHAIIYQDNNIYTLFTWPSLAQLTIVLSPVLGMNFACGSKTHESEEKYYMVTMLNVTRDIST